MFHFSSVTVSQFRLPGCKTSLGLDTGCLKRTCFRHPRFFGFLVSCSFFATLIRLLNVVTIAFRPRLPTFQRRYLKCPNLTVYRIGIGSDQSYHRLATGSPAYTFLRHCVFPVVRVLSSTLLPGFIGPESSVLSVNLPPSVPCPASGSPIRFGFMVPMATLDTSTGRLPWVRRTTSPYAVQLHFGSVHRILGLAHTRLLDLLPAAI
jgi:hypothetical protein